MTEYGADLAEFICENIGQGKSLRWCCREKRVSVGRVCAWINADREFGIQYARAREAAADALADEIIDIAGDQSRDPHDRRVQVDALKWIASKLKPHKYGDKLDLNHSGQIDTRIVPDAQLTDRIAKLLGEGGAVGVAGGAGAPALTSEALVLLPGNGTIEAGVISETPGVLPGGNGASGAADVGRKSRRKD